MTNSLSPFSIISEYIGVLSSLHPFNIYDYGDHSVSNIQKKVEDQSYIFSKLLLYHESDSKGYEHLDPSLFHIMKRSLMDSDSIILLPKPSDLLVFTAIAIYLNNILRNKGYTIINYDYREFYKSLSSRDNIDLIYRMDLTGSLYFYKKERLIDKLRSFLGKNPVLDLLIEFLNIEIINNEKNVQIDFNTGCIPPVGLLSNVLLQFILNDLDIAIEKRYPSIYYTRNGHEAYFTNCGGLPVEELKELLRELDFFGVIHILKRGCNIPCFVGNVSLDEFGKVEVKFLIDKKKIQQQ